MKSVFVRNCWYVAAWDYELGDQGVISRTIINEPVVIFRNQAGGLTALEDRCPHRGFPLSMGMREGDSLRCGYHGFKFNGSGACTEIPGKDRISAAVRARRYVAVEKSSWIWVWMGDPEAADESLIPTGWSLQDPAWSTAAAFIDYNAYYELLNDNLTDLSHLAYVHANSFGGAEWARGADRMTDLERGVRVERWSIPKEPSDRPGPNSGESWTTYDFLAPGVFILKTYGFPFGSAETLGLNPPLDRTPPSSVTWQAVTPTTDTTTRYFFGVGIPPNPMMDGQAALAVAKGGFEEDRICIEAQQRNLDLTGDHMTLAGHDEAPMRFRRILARLAQADGTAATKAPEPVVA